MFTTLFAALGCWKKPNIELAGGACDSNTNRCERDIGWHRPAKPDLEQTVAISTLSAATTWGPCKFEMCAFFTHDTAIHGA